MAGVNSEQAQPREWDGTTCITCGISLTRDTVWCEDHGPLAAERRAEKAARAQRPQGLAQWVDNPAVRNHLRRGILRLDEARAREGRPRFTEKQARRVMIHIARHLLTLRETIADTPRNSIERLGLLALLYRMIAQEAKWFTTGYPWRTARGDEQQAELCRFDTMRLNRTSDGYWVQPAPSPEA